MTVKLRNGASYQMTFPLEEQKNKRNLNKANFKP